MTMFKELSDKIKHPELESAVLQYWDGHKIFEKSVSTRAGRPTFTFYEGPPTANGRPGIHHVISRTLKDLACRYKTMRGFQVHRKAGWDTHGLPVEIEIERTLGIKHKDEIVQYGIARFNEECKKSVWKYKKDWEEMTRRMGYWLDLSNPYVTLENEYIESVWWALQRYFDAGMIYRDYKIQPYCPRCETPLSSHEVAQGYDDVRDPSVYVKFRILKGQSIKLENAEEYPIKDDKHFFLVWTTTPWTLVSNVALAVHPEVDYAIVDKDGETYITLLGPLLGLLEKVYHDPLSTKPKVRQTCKGRSLAGLDYERLFNYHPVEEKAFYVIEGDFVSTEEGTGIVHMAPAYGEDDYRTAKQYGLPTIHPVNKSGEFGDEVSDFKGMFVKEADAQIIANLQSRGLLYRKEAIVHSYPHCWRCETPLLYYARSAWYIRTTEYTDRMIALNKQINWIPSEVGEGRFGNWLAENKDWAVSRDRFWGTPLPIWMCDQGCMRCVGSVEEIRREGKNIPEPLDLHKPYMDQITFTCKSCGSEMRRVPEVIDAWFDSGSMPFAQWHYPFENKDLFEKRYPADFIAEGIDQTRGWFYTLHAIGTFLFDRPAYKNVYVNELILDKEGQKMSKSRGNVVDPFEMLARYGADSVRWYLVASSPPYRPKLFDEEGLVEVQRKFFSTLLNTYSFFALYANIDRFAYSEPRIPPTDRPEIDQWILSALNSLIRQYIDWMEEYQFTRAARAVSDFTVDQLSKWYVRRNRRRFWKSERGRDKLAAYQTLYECLVAITKMMAPIAPFLADEIYRRLNSTTTKESFKSVHLAETPAVEESAINLDLEKRMEKAQQIVYIVRSMRMRSNLKVRQPLKRIIVPVSSEQERAAVKRMEDVILDEINVKQVEFVSDDSEVVRKKAKPNFKSIGPKFGKSAQKVAEKIRSFTPAEIKKLEQEGTLTVSVNGEMLTISRGDVQTVHEDIKGWLVDSGNVLTIALDTELTEELINEGFAREFVNRVQNMRKDAGFEVTDRIKISYRTSKRLQRALQAMARYVAAETLAVELSENLSAVVPSVRCDVNGEECEISIERASK
ncbi:MAG: isoleucine--tRNA ligase [Bacteroidota bacterium]